MKIIVIIPTYNEKENIQKMIDVLEEEIFPQIKNHQMEILVVDDNSPDGTADVVKEKMKKYSNIHLSLGKKQGLGAAYKRGMKYAMEKMGAAAVIEFDADFQHDPRYIIDLVEKFDQGYDYVIGSRFVKGGSIPKEWSWYRKLLTIGGGLFSRFVLFFPQINKVKDVSTGLKLTRVKGVLDKVDFSQVGNGFFYKTQILYQIVKNGAKIIEIPLKFKLREKGESKITFKEVINTFLGVIKLRLNDPTTIRFLKFAVVGFIGYIINALGLELFYRLGLSPGPAAGLGAELAIISNFTLNNLWTFSEKRITGFKRIIWKFFQFNLTSLGAVILQWLVVGILAKIFGDQWRQIYLVIAIGFFVIPYNYSMYNIFIWKTWKVPFLKRIQERIG
ncbi:MAG: glycosyltransferase [Microgenomates group bacterium]